MHGGTRSRSTLRTRRRISCWAITHRERNQPQKAIAEYEVALRTAPDNTAVLNNLGLALQSTGQGDRALDCYRRALAIDPEQADALGNLANAQFARNDFRASAETYDRLFAIRSSLPAATMLRRAIALQKTQRLAEAEACFRDAGVACAGRRANTDQHRLAVRGAISIRRSGVAAGARRRARSGESVRGRDARARATASLPLARYRRTVFRPRASGERRTPALVERRAVPACSRCRFRREHTYARRSNGPRPARRSQRHRRRSRTSRSEDDYASVSCRPTFAPTLSRLC